MPERFRHDILLAALFIVYGAAHLIAVFFMWLVFLGLALVGYYHVLLMPATRALAVVTSLGVLLLLAAYELLKGRRRAGLAVMATCLATAAVGSAVVFKLVQSAVPHMSTRRLTFVMVYGVVSAGLCLYGAWAVKKRGPVEP